MRTGSTGTLVRALAAAKPAMRNGALVAAGLVACSGFVQFVQDAHVRSIAHLEEAAARIAHDRGSGHAHDRAYAYRDIARASLLKEFGGGGADAEWDRSVGERGATAARALNASFEEAHELSEMVGRARDASASERANLADEAEVARARLRENMRAVAARGLDADAGTAVGRMHALDAAFASLAKGLDSGAPGEDIVAAPAVEAALGPRDVADAGVPGARY